ncbi:MAG: integrase family protein [Gammaproteobacteria bacterium]|nr:integrase family protein [Gammaproteobacteria bacterium]
MKRFREAGYFPKGEEPLRSTTVKDYETALEERILPRWGATRLVDVRASMVEKWRNEMLEKGAGKSPVRKALIVMGRLYRFAKRDHIVTHNPTIDVGKPTVRSRKGAEERLTPEQLATLFDVLKGPRTLRVPKRGSGGTSVRVVDNGWARTRVVVHIGARTGLREGEIFGLRWKDVDLDTRTIQVRGQYTSGEFVEFPKTDAGVRTAPVEPELAAVLAEWKLAQVHDCKQPGSLVISTSTGGPISASNFLLREFYPALKVAELPRVVFHSLRHTYKTILVSSDTPPAAVHTILGHANFATTLKLYGGITSEALENAGGKVADAFKPKPDKNRTNGST